MDNKERKIGEVLKGQKFDLDKEGLWANMAGALPQKEKKRRGFWWLFLLLIPISYGAYYVMSGTFHPKVRTEIQLVENNENESRESEITTSESTVDEIIIGNNNDLISEVKVVNEAENQGATQPQVVIKQVAEDLTRTLSKRATIANSNKELTKTNNIDPIISSASPTRNQPLNPSLGSDLQAPDMRIRSRFYPVDIARIGMKSFTSIDEREFELELNANLTPTLCCVNPKWSLMMIGGALKSYSKVTGIEDRETGLYGASIDFQVNRHLSRRLTISGGLSYNQLNTRYLDQSEEREVTDRNGVSQINIDALGALESVQGTVEEISIVKNDISWHRAQQSIDFHAQLQKDFILSRRWKAGIIGGLAYNLYTSTKGFGYNDEEGGKFYKFERDDNQHYKTSAGMKPLIGAELCYALKNYELVFRTNYKWNLNPINTQIENYQIKNSQTGIQLGMRYYLNGN